LGPGFTVTPLTYRRVAEAALAVCTLIVFTGAAVRLTGSGLGCPEWPRCHGTHLTPQLSSHALIEFGNRMLTGVVSIPCLAAAILAWRRRPFRRDLALIALLLPLGVAGQAVLGGLTVRYGLSPSWVIAHFLLSMLLLVACVTLAWRARFEPGERPPASDRLATWAVRALLPLGALTIAAGTLATAAGPHAGGEGTHDVVPRLDWFGRDTLSWAIHQHGALAATLGLCAVAVWFLLRARGVEGQVREAVTAVCVLVASQGVVGSAQYAMKLPAEIVWIHVVLAALTWLSLVWAVAAAGRLAPAGAATARRASARGEPGTRARPPRDRARDRPARPRGTAS
jgi:cytochrome c oxidase assembly protein subunit 15